MLLYLIIGKSAKIEYSWI